MAAKLRRAAALFTLRVGVTVLALVAAAVGVLYWLEPPDPVFMPLCVSDYKLPVLPGAASAAQDCAGLIENSYFVRIEASAASQDAARLRQNLSGLKSLQKHDAVVIYLSALAHRDDKGSIQVLPADASPDDPRTWLPLRSVLERLRDCPARNKLLILDIMRPLPQPRLGVLADTVAGAIANELEASPDPHRLALCAAAPGQTTLTSPDMGRSLFGFYLEEGLRGYADGFGERGKRDGRISVGELAAFVQARVDRWALRNRGVHQTPVLLGSGSDFPLVTLDDGPRPHLPPAAPVAYPQWLVAGWQERDRRWRDGEYRSAPRAFQQEQAILEHAETAAGHSQDPASPQKAVAQAMAGFEKQLHRQHQLARPVSMSLAQAAADGMTTDPAVQSALEDVFHQVKTLAAQGVGSEDTEIRTRLVAAFRDKVKDKSDFAVGMAVLTHALQAKRLDADSVRLLDTLARPAAQSPPAFAEMLLLQQLADLAGRLEPADWPEAVARRALQTAYRGEILTSKPHAFAWTRDLLDQAVQARHDGEMCLWAAGYASVVEADQLLKKADDLNKVLLQRLAQVDKGCKTLAEALAVLPLFSPYLERAPEHLKTWQTATAVTRELDELLQPEQISAKSSLLRQMGKLERCRAKLAGLLDDLNKPFAAENLQRLHKASKAASAGPGLYRQMEALLSIPHPSLKAADRAGLWEAARHLSRRLHADTIRLDHLEDERHDCPVPFGDMAQQELAGREHEQAVRRAQLSIGLLRLGGLNQRDLQALEESFHNLDKKPDTKAAGALGVALRRVWGKHLPAQMATAPAGERERWSWVISPLEPCKILDDTDVPPGVEARRRQADALHGWLARHYRYLSRDYQGAGLEAPSAVAAKRFYEAALARLPLGVPPSVAFDIDAPAALAPLSAAQPSTSGVVKLTTSPSANASPLSVRIIKADARCVQVVPETSVLVPDKAGRALLPLKLRFRPDALLAHGTRPRGFVVQVRLDGRHFHHLVPVALPSGPNDLQILVSANPDKPEPLDDIHVRPGNVPQKYYVFAMNPTTRERKLLVKVNGAMQHVTLAAGETRRVRLDKMDSTTEFHGSLVLQLLDAEKNTVLDRRSIPVAVAAPTEYVRVSNPQFSHAGGKNRLSVRLKTSKSMAGPAIAAELVLSPQHIAGLAKVGGGTLKAEIPADHVETHLTLFADDVQFDPGAGAEGTISVDVDGVARAFLFRDPLHPHPDPRPSVRLVVPPWLAPQPTFSFPIEVDNAPAGAAVEISLGRLDQGAFASEQTRSFPADKKRLLRFQPHAPDGALVFEASVQDWTVELNGSHIVGQRALRARLVDRAGNALYETAQPLTIDATEPTQTRFLTPPSRVKYGSTVFLKAKAEDRESGIAAVHFFLGRPSDGNSPQPARIPARKGAADANTWTAPFVLPERKGPVEITVQATNGVGLSSFASIVVNLTDTDTVPVLAGTGQIRGKVLEGPRPQPGLEVILNDESGVEKARTTTRKDGTFLFDKVPAGRYVISCFKPITGRRATSATIRVEPDRTETVTLSLSL
jgi:hypothetical protein